MKNLSKEHSLTIQLFIIFIVFVIVSIAILTKAIEFAMGISIYAVLIGITILLISISEIRNRLRPWVAVVRIAEEQTENPKVFYTHFFITNTGSTPATRILYTTRWYLEDNNTWKEIEIPRESPFTSAQHTLFPNQSIDHASETHLIKASTRDKDTKVTFRIEYRGLWSKHTTTNTFRFLYSRKAWAPDEPQDYT